MKPTEEISAYHAEIGARGGRKSSPAKRRAARVAARKRWGHTDPAVLPIAELVDQTWYLGKGRNANIGIWDGKRGCFWVTSMNDSIDPERFPVSGERRVRLKREGHSNIGGSFHPEREIG